MPIEKNSTTRFSDRVENYVKYRPHYPEATYDFLTKNFQLDKTSHIADIGSGTGISTGPLLERGYQVSAVEPNDEMRAYAEKAFKKYPGFRSLNATAEATKIPNHSLDLILAAQAFHWFDVAETKKEFERVLKPDHFVGLLWNERIETGVPFLEGYETLLKTYGTDYSQVKRQALKQQGAFESFFTKGFEVKTFKNSQSFDFEGLKGRLLSSSYVPNASHPLHLPMLAALKQLFDQHSEKGKIEMPYETRLYFGKIS